MTQVTLQMMREYLERFGWSRYQAVDEPFEKEGILRTGWRSSEESDGYVMSIDPMVEKGCLSFKVHQILSAPMDSTPRDRLSDLWLAMNYLNFRIILGKFSYDPRDGEVRFSVDMPIDENTFTYEQFVHAMGVAIKTVEQYAPRLQAIVKGKQTAQQFIEQDSGGDVHDLLRMLGGLTLLGALLETFERTRGGETLPIYPSNPNICYWGHTQERQQLKLCRDGRNYVCPRCCHELCCDRYPAMYAACRSEGWPVWAPESAQHEGGPARRRSDDDDDLREV